MSTFNLLKFSIYNLKKKSNHHQQQQKSIGQITLESHRWIKQGKWTKLSSKLFESEGKEEHKKNWREIYITLQ